MGQVDWRGRALGAAVLVVALVAAGPAGAADCAVALVVNADSPEFSRARVEQAIGDGLGVPIIRLDEDSAHDRCGILVVTWRPSRTELAVTYETRAGIISRIVPTTADVDDGLRTAAALAANLVRNQASELIGTAPAAPSRAPAVASSAPAAPPVVEARPAPSPDRQRNVIVAVAVGTGFGPIGDLSQRPGLAWARLGHVAPEIGLSLSQRWSLSLKARWQYTTMDGRWGDSDGPCDAAGPCSSPKSAFAVFLNAAYVFTEPSAPVRGFASGALGVGEVAQVSSVPCTAGQVCSYISTAGPLLFGPGAGLAVQLAERLDIVVALAALMASPASMLNFDMNVGVAARF
jgi:hypothetical protein